MNKDKFFKVKEMINREGKTIYKVFFDISSKNTS